MTATRLPLRHYNPAKTIIFSELRARDRHFGSGSTDPLKVLRRLEFETATGHHLTLLFAAR